MKNLKIPQCLKEEVEFYLSSSQSGLDHQEELDSFLIMLYPRLIRILSLHFPQRDPPKSSIPSPK
jgi:hypothetical protein